MNKIERIIIGMVALIVTTGVFGVMVFRSSRPVSSQSTVSQTGASQLIKSDLLQSNTVSRLKDLEINGRLPVTVADDETHGDDRNPFE